MPYDSDPGVCDQRSTRTNVMFQISPSINEQNTWHKHWLSQVSMTAVYDKSYPVDRPLIKHIKSARLSFNVLFRETSTNNYGIESNENYKNYYFLFLSPGKAYFVGMIFKPYREMKNNTGDLKIGTKVINAIVSPPPSGDLDKPVEMTFEKNIVSLY